MKWDYKLSKPDPSSVLPPTRLHFLKFTWPPKHHCQLGTKCLNMLANRGQFKWTEYDINARESLQKVKFFIFLDRVNQSFPLFFLIKCSFLFSSIWKYPKSLNWFGRETSAHTNWFGSKYELNRCEAMYWFQHSHCEYSYTPSRSSIVFHLLIQSYTKDLVLHTLITFS